jgi:transcriptional regulator with XRE-family HTH domain
MVNGSHLNLMAEISYTNGEDLGASLRLCLKEHTEKIRNGKRRGVRVLPPEIGMRLTDLRVRRGFDTATAAQLARISERLIRSVEEDEVDFHNVGLAVLGRLLTIYNTTPAELFGAAATPSQRDSRDRNIEELEAIARTLDWSARDLCALRDEYFSEVAASGRNPRLTEDDWRRRHSALEDRRLRRAADQVNGQTQFEARTGEQATDAAPSQTTGAGQRLLF